MHLEMSSVKWCKFWLGLHVSNPVLHLLWLKSIRRCEKISIQWLCSCELSQWRYRNIRSMLVQIDAIYNHGAGLIPRSTKELIKEKICIASSHTFTCICVTILYQWVSARRTPLLTHWSYVFLALTHWNAHSSNNQFIVAQWCHRSWSQWLR